MTDTALVAGPDILALWEAYASLRDRHLRDQLVEKYLPLAKRIAGRLYRMRWEDSCSFDDYMQYATVGLMEAVERFDPRRQSSFEAFSSHRIRGAILNGLAKESEAAAQRHQLKKRKMTERTVSIAGHLLGEPQRATLEDLAQLTIGLALGMLLEAEEDEPTEEAAPDNPYVTAELHQMKQLAHASLDRLPEREREIIRSHYYEQFDFQTIAQQMGLTKGRVSQLHARALVLIRESIENRPRLDRRL